MYEESLQMPCLVRFPKGVKAGIKIDKIGLNIDIAPTLLDYAGVQIPGEMQGESLKPLLEQNKKAGKNWRESAYYQYFEYPRWHRVQPHYGVRTNRYKLIHFYYNIDVWELYDLKNDPNELINQFNNPDYQETLAELKLELKKLQRLYDDNLSMEQRRKLTDRYSVQYEH
jgi:arylsulfatase A-like enzyme